MTMLDNDFNGSKFKSKASGDSVKMDGLEKANMQKSDIPFEQQAEKKMQVFEAANRMNYAAWVEWMHDKNYSITKF